MTARVLTKILAVALLVLGLFAAPALRATPLHRDVLVFIPAYEASQLFDPTLGDATASDPTCVWGNLNVFFSSERYFALRNPNPLVPHLMLKVGPVDIYGGFVQALTHPRDDAPKFAPYTLGADFFIFTYDWRQEIADITAPQFARALESYAQIHAAKTGIPAAQTRFILVSHSMGGLVARTWLSENPAWAPRVAGMYLVGSPNRGSVKAVRTVLYGPDSVQDHARGFPGVLLNLIPTSVDQNVTKLVGITRPTLYELLPMDDPEWTDSAGRHVPAAALLQPGTWEPSWPTAELEKKLFIDGWLKDREAEGRKPIRPADWEFCQDAGYGHLKQLLRETADWRACQGPLQHTAALLRNGNQGTRLRIIASTGIKTPSGVVSHGQHDSTQAFYIYPKGNDGDGTMEESCVLDGFSADAPNVKILQGVAHGKLMLDRGFLAYFLGELSGQPMVSAR